MVRTIALIFLALSLLVYLDRPPNVTVDARRRAEHQLEFDNSTGFDHDWFPSIDTAGDHGWVLARVVGILSMQGGFALLEAGSVRPANKANIMMKNVADLSVSLVGYAIIGYSLSFASGNTFIGGMGRAFLLHAEDEYTIVLHQFSFAATTGTIVSGAVAERMRFKAYLVVTVALTNVLYAACCHWVWHSEGWLLQRRFVDFAGAGVVHLLGGVCALVATMVIGPRFGRFGTLPPILVWLKNKKFRARQQLARLGCFRLIGGCRLHAHRMKSSTHALKDGSLAACPAPAAEVSYEEQARNARRKRVAKVRAAADFRISDPVNVIYGTFVLWVGWISFNCSGTLGLTSGREALTARVGLVTMFGGAFGAIAGLCYSQAQTRGAAFEIEPASIGTLAGLVSITAACANIGIWEGSLAGFLGGLLACASREGLEYLHIDDPVGAIPVHGVAGLWGLLVVGFFHRAEGFGPATLPGLFHGGDGGLLLTQLVGGLAIFAWGAAGTWLMMQLSRCFLGLRVSRQEEELGLDIAEHAVNASVGERKERNASSNPLRRTARKIVGGVGKFAPRCLSRSAAVPAPADLATVKVEEYIEDVGQAAGVGFAARRAAAKWRSTVMLRRAAQNDTAAASQGVDLEVGVEEASAEEDDDHSVAAAGVMAASMSP